MRITNCEEERCVEPRKGIFKSNQMNTPHPNANSFDVDGGIKEIRYHLKSTEFVECPHKKSAPQ